MTVSEVNALLSRALEPGWEAVLPYFKSSAVVSSPGGGAGGGTSTDVVTEILGGGVGLIVADAWFYNIDGVGLDYLIWTARQNGQPIQGMDTIIGAPGPGSVSFPLNAIMTPGQKFALNVVNLSGTGTFPPSSTVRVAAVAAGYYIARVRDFTLGARE